MVYRILGENIPHAWEEFKWTFYGEARDEDTRNGPVWTIPYPAMLEILNPRQRIMFDPQRDCNPFFHLMEFIWMMAGSKDLEWIKRFNKQMGAYSDDGRTLPANYGYRWRKHFGFDQIVRIMEQIREDPTTRRAVLSMWDPDNDMGNNGLDKPCNTQIYFRIIHGCLDMLVTNRSNDAIWGMFGTNAVHMTLLQELIALGTGLGIGTYRVASNNLHVYKNLPNVDHIMQKAGPSSDYYKRFGYEGHPLILEGETAFDFLTDAENFVDRRAPRILKTVWFNAVATHMKEAYLDKPNRLKICRRIEAQDWKVASTQWAERHV